MKFASIICGGIDAKYNSKSMWAHLFVWFKQFVSWDAEEDRTFENSLGGQSILTVGLLHNR